MYSDEQLIRKIKRNQNRDAADELIRRYYKEIYAYVYRQTGNMDMAMDLTQDIFISILQGMNSFDERKAQFRTWTYHVAANKITDYYRSREHKRKQIETALLLEEADSGFGAGWPEEDSLLEIIINRESIRHIMEIVVGFDGDWIKIFQKKCFEERTFAEIAALMKLPENTVKTRFYSMIRKIKKEVNPNEN